MVLATAADLSHEQLFGHLAGDQFTAQEAAEYLEIPLPTLYGIVTSRKLVPNSIDGYDLMFAVPDLKAFKKALKVAKG